MVGLEFEGVELKGFILFKFGDFFELEVLNLMDNEFEGVFLEELCNCRWLMFVDLWKNLLDGFFFFGILIFLFNLVELFFFGNKFMGNFDWLMEDYLVLDSVVCYYMKFLDLLYN